MAQPGDTVRYLNSTGGGIIRRIEGNIAYVEEDGFETPVMVKELVVVLPAGHKGGDASGAALMFDQSAYDLGRAPPKAPVKSKDKNKAPKENPAATVVSAMTAQMPQQDMPETAYGDRLSLSLAFEPADTRRLSETTFNAVLVNDSNYALQFVFCARKDEEREFHVIYQGLAMPNELVDLAQFTHASLLELEHVALQAVAYKSGKAYEIKPPVNVSRRLDLTKFHKLHCFRPGVYFDSPVIEVPLLKEDEYVGSSAPATKSPAAAAIAAAEAYSDSLDRLKGKYSKAKGVASKQSRQGNPADNPHKLLPLIEVDLHIGELCDTTAGMQPKDMLQMQLDEVRKIMQAHRLRQGQKIVFIHGKGDGVLRKAVISLLKKEYPKCDLQDASFREYGFGATLVTVN